MARRGQRHGHTGRRIAAVGHLRARPQRIRELPARDGAADRQEGPGFQPYPGGGRRPRYAFPARSFRGGVFNVTDSEPAPPQDVIAEAARLMGVEPPPEELFETAEMTPMARSFYGSNKRISNRRIRDLGFQFQFPDYRMSLRQLWESRSWDENDLSPGG